MELLPNRNRALALGLTLALHAAVIAALLLLAPHYAKLTERAPGLVAVPLTEPSPPPPPPPPDDVEEGAPAPPSRGADDAPSPPEPPRPLPKPTPAQVAIDPGTDSGAGLGAAAGSGAGTGGEGSGSGAGGAGSGRGAGTVAPPMRIAGEFTRADYRRADAPRGASGTVVVSFRVRTDGMADRCAVLRSSGYREFDQGTCQVIERRFRYRPARNGRGEPIEWEIRTDFTWTPG